MPDQLENERWRGIEGKLQKMSPKQRSGILTHLSDADSSGEGLKVLIDPSNSNDRERLAQRIKSYRTKSSSWRRRLAVLACIVVPSIAAIGGVVMYSGDDEPEPSAYEVETEDSNSPIDYSRLSLLRAADANCSTAVSLGEFRNLYEATTDELFPIQENSGVSSYTRVFLRINDQEQDMAVQMSRGNSRGYVFDRTIYHIGVSPSFARELASGENECYTRISETLLDLEQGSSSLAQEDLGAIREALVRASDLNCDMNTDYIEFANHLNNIAGEQIISAGYNRTSLRFHITQPEDGFDGFYIASGRDVAHGEDKSNGFQQELHIFMTPEMANRIVESRPNVCTRL